MNRDVIVLGASAGSLTVLLELVSELPRDLPAALFVVLHQAPGASGLLPRLMSERGPLVARHPLHGERIAPGHIYVAPPDNQLLLRQGSVEVVRGPKENGHRPAVDALFRSASAAYGPRVIGVVLSGHQDCGTAGMMSIKARGGIGVVQSPESAEVPDMPTNVLRSVAVDHVVQPRELGALLARLAAEAPGPALPVEQFVHELEGGTPGQPSSIVCPICQGVLTETHAGETGFEQLRCHVGHAFSMQALVREQGESLERALWAAVRALEESAALSQRLSHKDTSELRQRFQEKAATQSAQADQIRQILLHGGGLSRGDSRHV